MSSWQFAQPPTTCFTVSRLTNTVFKIVEDDMYRELPFIYVKVYPHSILILDTGCGGAARDPTVHLKSLRQFIETWPIIDNAGKPINERGRKPYVVVQSHLHYVCAMEQFTGSTIVASSYSKLFVTSDLATHSLCRSLGIRTPNYQITKWAGDCDFLTHNNFDLKIQVLHTPGHTPDSLALWDEEENMLYVGDTLYEWAPTIFPNEGDIVDWLGSMDKLYAFVKEKTTFLIQEQSSNTEVYINCGHVTSYGPALEILGQMNEFMLAILRGSVPIMGESIKRGERNVVYGRQGTDRFVVLCPERLILEARDKLEIVV
ncbi:Metallo-hydrolase/oxidoreductase [Sistotremastrum niveocremeum HHB9708]|uniref:Metallo-hydrolase/oxidoreductase n=1 Tax=Sistotremastrum niveocremeum HHB9708 TaxID=1314777 RepID=A0A164TIN9_9AGAM|nr:Metallo-hydrolase/oxidoreductase [Sistotremastrum niveocremeum HHB9708]